MGILTDEMKRVVTEIQLTKAPLSENKRRDGLRRPPESRKIDVSGRRQRAIPHKRGRP